MYVTKNINAPPKSFCKTRQRTINAENPDTIQSFLKSSGFLKTHAIYSRKRNFTISEGWKPIPFIFIQLREPFSSSPSINGINISANERQK